jgi:flagellar biogenesis protein FliO
MNIRRLLLAALTAFVAAPSVALAQQAAPQASPVLQAAAPQAAAPQAAAPQAAAPQAAAPAVPVAPKAVLASPVAQPAAPAPAPAPLPVAHSPAPVAVAAPVPAPVAAPVAVAPTPALAPAPAEVQAAPPSQLGTPLATRPTKALTLAPEEEGTPAVYKLLVAVLILAGAAVWMKTKWKVRTPALRRRIDVLGRTSLGVRSELLVVEVEGTRLLVGTTPSSIQTLAILDSPPAIAPAGPEEMDDPEPLRPSDRNLEEDEEPRGSESPLLEVADRARALLGSVRPSTKSPTATSSKRPAAAPSHGAKIPRVAGQAKGLLLALEPNEDRDTRERRASAGGPARTRDV